MRLLSQELGCDPAEISDFELSLYDINPSVLGGANQEFVFSPRLDNLHSSFCALQGLLASVKDEAQLTADPMCRVVALFDHEEVCDKSSAVAVWPFFQPSSLAFLLFRQIGSASAQGAESSLFQNVLHRLSLGGEADAYDRAVPKSFIVSADMAHAVHPNYSEKHEENHKPAMNKGPVIKFNTNQRYATNAVTASVLREIARKADVPLQVREISFFLGSACIL